MDEDTNPDSGAGDTSIIDQLVALPQPGKAEATTVDVQAWVSIRTSIGVFDQLVMTLLTQGTLLVFAALGVIFGASPILGPWVTMMLGVGVLFGVVMLHLGVSRYTMSISVAATAAKELEDRLWPDKTAPNRISHRLAGHALAASRRLGRLYYHVWSYSLLFLVTIMLAILGVRAASPEWPTESKSKSQQRIQPDIDKSRFEPPGTVDHSATTGSVGQEKSNVPQKATSQTDDLPPAVPKPKIQITAPKKKKSKAKPVAQADATGCPCAKR